MVHQTHRFDVCNTCQVHTHAHHIAQVGAGLRQRESNLLVNIARLAGRVNASAGAAKPLKRRAMARMVHWGVLLDMCVD